MDGTAQQRRWTDGLPERIIAWALASAIGIGTGLSINVLAENRPVKLDEMTLAVVLSPIAIPGGLGGWLALSGFPKAFGFIAFAGGCLFWPAFWTLTYLWLKHGRPRWILVVHAALCAWSFSRVLLGLDGIMSA